MQPHGTAGAERCSAGSVSRFAAAPDATTAGADVHRQSWVVRAPLTQLIGTSLPPESSLQGASNSTSLSLILVPTACSSRLGRYGSAAALSSAYPRSAMAPTVMAVRGIGTPAASIHPVITSFTNTDSRQCDPAVP